MSRGEVSATGHPIVTLDVLDSGQVSKPVQFMMDTGFSGYLTLNPADVAALGIPDLSTKPGFRNPEPPLGARASCRRGQ